MTAELNTVFLSFASFQTKMKFLMNSDVSFSLFRTYMLTSMSVSGDVSITML